VRVAVITLSVVITEDRWRGGPCGSP